MEIDAIVARVIEKLGQAENAAEPAGGIPAGVSNRHVHLSQGDADALFGAGYSFKRMKELSQPGQFACDECVTVVGPRGVIEKVRVLGPVRRQSQIELLQSDCRKLGIKAVLRESGKLEGTPGLTLCGPNGSVTVSCGAIVAKRHIHMTPADAARLGCTDAEIVEVRCGGERGGTLGNVVVRVSTEARLDCHIDIEEAACMGLKDGDTITINGKGR